MVMGAAIAQLAWMHGATRVPALLFCSRLQASLQLLDPRAPVDEFCSCGAEFAMGYARRHAGAPARIRLGTPHGFCSALPSDMSMQGKLGDILARRVLLLFPFSRMRAGLAVCGKADRLGEVHINLW